MPKTKATLNEENIVALYREHLKLVNSESVDLIKDLEGEELSRFYKFCHETFHNPFFGRILNGFILEQCLKTGKDGVTEEHYKNGRLSVAGMKMLEDFYARAALEYDKMTAKQEDFDPSASFSPAKI
jgi:hypothetical protein